MNLPNKLTVFRIILTPIFLLFLIWDSLPHSFLIGLVLFIVASLTDMLDGKIARKYNLITDFGKFLDPLADKMLTFAAFIGFMKLEVCMNQAAWSWFLMIVLAREFLVTSFRLIASGKGVVVAADIWGKAKTVSQMLSIILILFVEELKSRINFSTTAVTTMTVVGIVLVWITALLTVISGVNYIVSNKNLLDGEK